MRDYNYYDEEGKSAPVATLSTALITELLSGGFQIINNDGCTDPKQAVRDRLLLELFIRERNLR